MLAAEPPRRILIGFLGVSHSHALEKFKVVRESSEFELIGVVEDAEAVRAPYARLGAKFISREEPFARAEVVVVDSAVADHARDAKLALPCPPASTFTSRSRPPPHYASSRSWWISPARRSA